MTRCVRFLSNVCNRNTADVLYLADSIGTFPDIQANALIAGGHAEPYVRWTDDQLEAMSIADLRDLVGRMGAETARRKIDLIANIRAAQEGTE